MADAGLYWSGVRRELPQQYDMGDLMSLDLNWETLTAPPSPEPHLPQDPGTD